MTKRRNRCLDLTRFDSVARTCLLVLFAVLSILAVSGRGAASANMDTTAKAAIVKDMTSGTILMEKNPDVRLPPASMSKLMTLYLLFDALKDKRVSLQTRFQVSRKAAEMGGSKMFLREGETVTVDDLIRGVIVQSGNDACIAIAENLAGTEEAFVRFMNLQGEAMGLETSTFANSTGWPHPHHLMSAMDLITLAERIIADFPDY